MTVEADPAARLAGDIDSVIASLPISLRIHPGPTQLRAIAGENGWTTAALQAIATGALGLMVVDPVVEDVAALDAAAAAAGVPVIIDQPLAGNPLVPLVTSYFGDPDHQHALLESRVVMPVSADMDRAMIDQLALLRVAGAAVESAAALAWTARGYVAQGCRHNGQRVLMTGIRTNAQPRSGYLRVLTPTGSVELKVPDPATARPGQAMITTPQGVNLLPTLFETAHRAAWRRLIDHVRRQRLALDLDGFRKDVAVMATLAAGR